MRYAHVEKLALDAVQVVQRFRHYILLHTVTVISDCNPMTYILSRKFLGGGILKVDRYPPRVWFGIYYCQIKEITGFCWSDLFSPYRLCSFSVRGSYPRRKSLPNQHPRSMVWWYHRVPPDIYLQVRVDERCSTLHLASVTTLSYCWRYPLSCWSRFHTPSMPDPRGGWEGFEWLSQWRLWRSHVRLCHRTEDTSCWLFLAIHI